MNTKQIVTYLRTTARELEMSEARADGAAQMNKILMEANDSLAAQVASLKEVRGMIETDRAVLQEKLDCAVQVGVSLKARVEELESYAKETAVTIDQLRASKDNAVRGFSEQTDRANRMQAAFEDARDRENEANCRASAYAGSIDRVQQELDDKLKVIADLEQCLKNMREKHVDLIRDVTYWKLQASNMETNWKLTIAEADKIKQRIRPVELENYILKMNIQAAQNTVRDLQVATEAKELALAAQVAENSSLRGVIGRLREKLSKYWLAAMEDQKLAPPGLESFIAGAIKQTEEEC